MLSYYIDEILFEEWLADNEFVERITDANMGRLAGLLASEEDEDSYAISAAYYAFTGRKGLWLYHYDKTYVPFCWHPNVDGQILIFPPRGKKNYAAIATFVDEAPLPPAGFLLARYKPKEIRQLKTLYAFARRIGFEPVEEKVLDWQFPSRILSTLNTSQMLGRRYVPVRNRVRRANEYSVKVQKLSAAHLDECEVLASRWANEQAGSLDELPDLTNPYKEMLRLWKNKSLGLDGLVYFVDGYIQAISLWDVSNPVHKIGNLYMNLCNLTYSGLSELAITTASMTLCEAGVPLLSLGGSETAGLDHYKCKFAPILSVELCSLKASVARKSFAADHRKVQDRELRVA